MTIVSGRSFSIRRSIPRRAARVSRRCLADWEADKREQFEERWPQVQAVLGAFEELGIYLLDVSPGNIGS